MFVYPGQESAAMICRAILGLAIILFAFAAKSDSPAGASAHDFTFTAIEGGPLPLANYAGKALLVVNTASFCGFTKQYDALQELWQEYGARGLVVLGVPSNDFGKQEPGTAAEIKRFCETNYHIDFPLTEKTTVSGEDAHPFYKWAAREAGWLARPRWNFHKYLIAPDGSLSDWFSTPTSPTSRRVKRAIEALLLNTRSVS